MSRELYPGTYALRDRLRAMPKLTPATRTILRGVESAIDAIERGDTYEGLAQHEGLAIQANEAHELGERFARLHKRASGPAGDTSGAA